METDKKLSDWQKRSDDLDRASSEVLSRLMAMTAEDVIISLRNLPSSSAKSLADSIEEKIEIAAYYFAKYRCDD